MARMDQRLMGESPKVSKNSCIVIRKGDLDIDGRDTVTGLDTSRKQCQGGCRGGCREGFA